MTSNDLVDLLPELFSGVRSVFVYRLQRDEEWYVRLSHAELRYSLREWVIERGRALGNSVGADAVVFLSRDGSPLSWVACDFDSISNHSIFTV